MKILKFFGIAALGGFLLTGCASVAHVERDKSVNFNNYHTYAWADSKEENGNKNTKTADLTERRMKEAINAEMDKAGWKISKGRPDVLLSYDVLVERNVRDQSNPVYSQSTTRLVFNPYSRRWIPVYYPSQFLGYDNNQVAVREGTITVSMIDARTDKTIWQGWTTDEVNSRNLTNKEIQSSVKTIFRKFDVAKN